MKESRWAATEKGRVDRLPWNTVHYKAATGEGRDWHGV